MGNCAIVIVLFVALLFIMIASSSRSNYSPLGDIDLSAHNDNQRVCRCVPKLHKAVIGDTWGESVRCPEGTLWGGMELWCSSNSEKCVHDACNSINF